MKQGMVGCACSPSTQRLEGQRSRSPWAEKSKILFPERQLKKLAKRDGKESQIRKHERNIFAQSPSRMSGWPPKTPNPPRNTHPPLPPPRRPSWFLLHAYWQPRFPQPSFLASHAFRSSVPPTGSHPLLQAGWPKPSAPLENCQHTGRPRS